MTNVGYFAFWMIPWSIVGIIAFGTGPYCSMCFIPLISFIVLLTNDISPDLSDIPKLPSGDYEWSENERTRIIDENTPPEMILFFGKNSGKIFGMTYCSAAYAIVCSFTKDTYVECKKSWDILAGGSVIDDSGNSVPSDPSIFMDKCGVPFYYSDYSFEIFVFCLLFLTVSFSLVRFSNYSEYLTLIERNKEIKLKIKKDQRTKEDEKQWENSLEEALRKKEISLNDYNELNKKFKSNRFSANLHLDIAKRANTAKKLEKANEKKKRNEERKIQRKIENEERRERENYLLGKYGIEFIVEQKRISEGKLLRESGFRNRVMTIVGGNQDKISKKERKEALKWASLVENEDKYLR